jgi:signal peptide peptidase SppA
MFAQSLPAFAPELARIALAPVAVTPAFAGHFAELLAIDPDRLRAAGPNPVPRRSNASPAAVGLFGMLFPRSNILTELGYGTALDEFASTVSQLADDDSVSEIVIVVDSPGGSVYGVQEAADAVYAANRVKQVTAAVDSEAASAAYWIASQASELVVTDGGQVGSIGVYQLHTDKSQAMAKAGVSPTLVSAGERKTAGHPYAPLDPIGREEIQSSVDDYYNLFVKAVARGRNTTPAAVRNGFGRGGMVRASGAIAGGMADRVASFDQIVKEKVGGPSSRRSSSGGRASTSEPTVDHEIEIRKRRMRLGTRLLDAPYKAASSPVTKSAPVTQAPTRDPILWGTALHESGHAIAAIAMGVPFDDISAVPDSKSLGRINWRPAGRNSDESLAVVLWGGLAAERLSELPHRSDDTSKEDRRLIGKYCPNTTRQKSAWETACALVKKYEAGVRLVAAKLLATPTRTLSAEQVEAYSREAGM